MKILSKCFSKNFSFLSAKIFSFDSLPLCIDELINVFFFFFLNFRSKYVEGLISDGVPMRFLIKKTKKPDCSGEKRVFQRRSVLRRWFRDGDHVVRHVSAATI